MISSSQVPKLTRKQPSAKSSHVWLVGVCLHTISTTWGGGAYLKYLKPIDVEHAHDFVASFRLSLRGDNLDQIRKIANPVMYRQCESRRIYGIS